MNERWKMLLRCIMWFAISFVLMWVAGVGILFESINALRALIVFSGIFTIVFEAIYQVDVAREKQIKGLQKRIEELERE